MAVPLLPALVTTAPDSDNECYKEEEEEEEINNVLAPIRVSNSPRPSLGGRNSLTVPTSNPLDAPPGAFNQGRRTSARLLSLNVREALRQLRRREHKKRVTALVQRNADFYRKRKCVECTVTAFGLVAFSAFSLYVAFAYGIQPYRGDKQVFDLIEDFPRHVQSEEVSERCTLLY